VLAEASQAAIEKVTLAIGNNELPVAYLLGEKYIEAMKAMSASQNAKVVFCRRIFLQPSGASWVLWENKKDRY